MDKLNFRKEILTDFLDWMDEINNTNPMQLETDNDDIAAMYLDSGRNDLRVSGKFADNELILDNEEIHDYYKEKINYNYELNTEAEREAFTSGFIEAAEFFRKFSR